MVQIQKTRATAPQLQRRREILRAASRVFRRRGFHGAGMRDIAAALGIAVGKLYYYFEDKQELLAFCQQDTLRRLLRLADSLEGLHLDASAALFLLVRGHIRCLNRGGSLAHLEVESLDARHRGPILALRNRYQERLEHLVAEGIKNGIFEPVDPKLAVLALLGAANWTVKWYRPRGRMPLDVIERSFARQQVRGLLAAPGILVEPADELVPDVTDSEDQHD